MLKRRPDSFSKFAQKVFAVVAKIPRGKTMTYGEVARAAGCPRAHRSVGNILSQNYDPKIPCHRVLRADGKPSGYNRGGATAKLKLLQKERARP